MSKLNFSEYKPDELTRLAKSAVKGRGRYRGWALQIIKRPDAGDAISLVVSFTCKQDGCSATTSVRL